MTMLHFRKCFDCGSVDAHGDSAGPGVRCTKCLSMDTRRFKPDSSTFNDAAAPGATLDLNWLFLNHATVREAIKRGATPQQVILLLAAQNGELLGRLMRSESARTNPIPPEDWPPKIPEVD